MKIYSVNDPEFKPYGQIVTGLDSTVQQILPVLSQTPITDGVEYVPEEPRLQELSAAKVISRHCYGGMPVQLGWCNGHNTKLNCFEYHRDSEFNLGSDDFILLLAKQDEITDGVLDTEKVKAFHVPAGVMVEVYATTLHYAPCHADSEKGFHVMVALPAGTNTAKPEISVKTPEDKLLWACNKWLLAHESSSEASQGAYIGLKGENVDIADSI